MSVHGEKQNDEGTGKAFDLERKPWVYQAQLFLCCFCSPACQQKPNGGLAPQLLAQKNKITCMSRDDSAASSCPTSLSILCPVLSADTAEHPGGEGKGERGEDRTTQDPLSPVRCDKKSLLNCYGCV